MRTLLPKKTKYYKEFADVVNKNFRQLRFGIESCKPGTDMDLAFIRKEIVDWQAIEDEDALCQVNMNYMTWTPVSYRNDNLVQFDTSADVWGPGYTRSSTPNAPTQAGVGFTYGNGSNIVEVNTGGCVTRINLNPAITINQNSSFQFTQQTAATIWTIQHSMGLIPNVRLEDLSGADIQGQIDIIDDNNLRVVFNQAVAGRAYLS